MSDYGSRRWRGRLGRAALVVAAVGIAACGSTARSGPASPPPAQARTQAAAAHTAEPVEIRDLELRDGTPDVVLEVTADAPLTWTSFRDPEGRLIIELPNSVPAAGVADLYPDAGLVSAVRVEQPARDGGPLTRLVVATRQEVEHSVSGEGANLAIELSPMGDVVEIATVEPAAGDTISYEPLPSDDGEMEAAAAPGMATEPASRDSMTADSMTADSTTADSMQADSMQAGTTAEPPTAVAVASSGTGAGYPTEAGTADDPFVAPPPTGAPASRVGRLAVEKTSHGTVVRVVGDGQFAYSTFALDNPHRFVIDLDGVVNKVESPSTSVGGVVERIRVGQFRSQPQAVSRVVFDLDAPIIPRIERTSDALVVSFGELNGNSPLRHRTATGVMPAIDHRGSQGAVEATPQPARAEPQPASTAAMAAPSTMPAAEPRRWPPWTTRRWTSRRWTTSYRSTRSTSNRTGPRSRSPTSRRTRPSTTSRSA